MQSMACKFSSISFSRSSPFNLQTRTFKGAMRCFIVSIVLTWIQNGRLLALRCWNFYDFLRNQPCPLQASTFRLRRLVDLLYRWWKMLEDYLDDDDTHLDQWSQHPGRGDDTDHRRRLPLPRQNTNTTTLAHPLESPLCLLHFIVNSVQAFLNVIELLCNHQMLLNCKTWVLMKNKIFSV